VLPAEGEDMWVIVHTVTGLALGSLMAEQSYWAIALAALLLHVVLDLVPHWDYANKPHDAYWGVADVLLSVIVLVVARTAVGIDWKLVAAAVVSAAPDLDVLNALLPTQRRWRLFPSHWSRFPHGSCAPLPGIAIQGALCVCSVIILAVT
jgi:hypothetical protein